MSKDDSRRKDDSHREQTFCFALLKDWVMLGAVGAYDWNGTVLMVKDSGISMPNNDTFRDRRSERNEPLAAYLGKRNSPPYNTFQQMLQDLSKRLFKRNILQIILHFRSLGASLLSDFYVL